jgi:uncharacterized protein (DUF1778 family)
MTAQAQIEAKVASQSVEMLKEMATEANKIISCEADYVLNAIMQRLEAVMIEADFVAFADTL